MKKAAAYPHNIFDEICAQNGWNDANIEDEKDKAFISIICTDDVQNHYLEEKEEHWFKENHSNVLNLEFDDVRQDIEWDDYKAHAITDEQAEDIVNFIENNIEKNIMVHCRAGLSRSGAIEHFIHLNYDWYKDEEDNDYIRPNSTVLAKLNKVLWKRHFKEDESN